MDLNYLLHRHQLSLFMAENAQSEQARLAHRGLAKGYAADRQRPFRAPAGDGGVSIEPTDISVPHHKPEDTAAGCRILASGDRERAEASDSAHMRFRLACRAEAWTMRAELLDRMEANRIQMNGERPPAEARDVGNDDG